MRDFGLRRKWVFISGIIWLLACGTSAYLNGWAKMQAEVATWIFYTAGPFGAVLVFWFVINLIRADLTIENDRLKQEHEAQSGLGNPRLHPILKDGVPVSSYMQLLIEDPKRIEHSPPYLQRRSQFHPDDGFLSPEQKVNKGMDDFNALYEEAIHGDYASYQVANSMAEWLRKNTRYYYGSTEPFHNLCTEIDRKMTALHDEYKKWLR